MQKSLMYKFFTIVGLCALFLFGLVFISNLVSERQQYYHTVMDDIKKTHVGDQQMITPFVAIANAQGVYIPQFATRSELNNQTKVSNQDYKRSIYRAISYNDAINIKQEFNFNQTLTNPAPFIKKTEQGFTIINDDKALKPSAQSNPTPTTAQATPPNSATFPSTATSTTVATPTGNPTPTTQANNQPPERYYQWQTAKLIIPVSDLRGVNLPTVTINGKPYNAQFPKQKTITGMNYIEVNLAEVFANETNRLNLQTAPLKVNIDLGIAGVDSISVMPLGDQFSLALQANWTEPKFYGDALPTKQFSPAGFSATWQNQFLAMNNNQQISNCLYSQGTMDCPSTSTISTNNQRSEYEAVESAVGDNNYKWLSTAFVDTNNTYTQTDRTLKYALLLLMVSFGTFFLFEVLKNLRIHPIQYGLVATALLVFYVLLLSFAEHIVFWQAYLIASVACVGLIGWYASFVLHSVKRSLGFSTILGGLYAGFYLILASEGMNLLLGAVFCFALLATVMFLTRKIDWYKIGENRSSANVKNPPAPALTLAEQIKQSGQ
ncbi:MULTISPECIES: cell envelope integrity protein CreD [unclassified Moraxella]|uniref:cell envelope integrity protein CreD n=1 Tax=unclassified Moraxella TaxID=2685852 RepID=UPI003AF66335